MYYEYMVLKLRAQLEELGPVIVCGNGDLELGEECDDGNTTSGDGCNTWCHVEDAQIAFTWTGTENSTSLHSQVLVTPQVIS